MSEPNDHHCDAPVERALRRLEDTRGRCGECHPEVALRLSELGLALAEQQQVREAEDAFRASMALLVAADEADDDRVAVVECRLASLLETTPGRQWEAELLFRRALEVLEATLGFDDEVTLAVQERHTGLLRRTQLPQ